MCCSVFARAGSLKIDISSTVSERQTVLGLELGSTAPYPEFICDTPAILGNASSPIYEGGIATGSQHSMHSPTWRAHYQGIPDSNEACIVRNEACSEVLIGCSNVLRAGVTTPCSSSSNACCACRAVCTVMVTEHNTVCISVLNERGGWNGLCSW